MRVCATFLALCLFVGVEIAAESACYELTGYRESIGATETKRTTLHYDEGEIHKWEDVGPGHEAFGETVDSISFVHTVIDISPPMLPDGMVKLAILKLRLRTPCRRDLTLTIDQHTYDRVKRWQYLVRPDWGEWINVQETILADGEIHVTLDADPDSECDWDGDGDDGDVEGFDDTDGYGEILFAPDEFDFENETDRSPDGSSLALCPTPERGKFVLYRSVLDVVYRPAIPLDVDNTPEALPDQLALSANYPNPFNPSTTIEFSLPTRSQVRVEVLNTLGQTVKTLLDESMPAGPHQVVWNGRSSDGRTVSSGIYYYRIAAGEEIIARKMILLK